MRLEFDFPNIKFWLIFGQAGIILSCEFNSMKIKNKE